MTETKPSTREWVGLPDDAQEMLLEATRLGRGDGPPFIPPTEDRIEAMLAGVSASGDQLVGRPDPKPLEPFCWAHRRKFSLWPTTPLGQTRAHAPGDLSVSAPCSAVILRRRQDRSKGEDDVVANLEPLEQSLVTYDQRTRKPVKRREFRASDRFRVTQEGSVCSGHSRSSERQVCLTASARVVA
jgi:hypothetical protein